QKVKVSAAGGVVPAFTTELTLPMDAFALQGPAISPMLTAEINHQADVAVAWTGKPDKVRLELSQDALSNHGTYIECLFSGAAGKGTVPASVMTDLVPTSG